MGPSAAFDGAAANGTDADTQNCAQRPVVAPGHFMPDYAAIPKDEKMEKTREKKVEAARKDLEAAVAALAQPGESYTPIGKLYPRCWRSSRNRPAAPAAWP